MNILNDTEHRLFLSAMQREKKICAQFDNSGYSGIKLLPICRSIERKVDKAIEPRKGHWIVNKWGNISCSECGCNALYDKVYTDNSPSGKVIRIKTTFCPTCGADMREVEE